MTRWPPGVTLDSNARGLGERPVGDDGRLPARDPAAHELFSRGVAAITVEAVADRADTPVGFALASIVAAAQSQPDVAEAFRERRIGARRRDAYQAVERAKARKQIRPDTDADMLPDVIFGPVYYRLLTGYVPLDEGLVDAALNGVARNGVAITRRRRG